MLFELRESERPIVKSTGQAEAVFYQHFFPGPIAVIHATDLRHGHVRLIHKQQIVVWKIVEQGGRLFAWLAVGQVATIVLDAFHKAGLFHHFEIKTGALFQPLGLE